MNLETAWQRIAVLGICFGLVAVIFLVLGGAFMSLSDANAAALGGWLEANLDTVVAGLVGLVPAIATYLFGRRAGWKVGKTEVFNSAIATASGQPTGEAAAEELRAEADAHRIRVTT
jgi:hypothetical protein